MRSTAPRPYRDTHYYRGADTCSIQTQTIHQMCASRPDVRPKHIMHSTASWAAHLQPGTRVLLDLRQTRHIHTEGSGTGSGARISLLWTEEWTWEGQVHQADGEESGCSQRNWLDGLEHEDVLLQVVIREGGALEACGGGLDQGGLVRVQLGQHGRDVVR